MEHGIEVEDDYVLSAPHGSVVFLSREESAGAALVRITGNKFTNCATGIKTSGDVKIVAENNVFHNVARPYDFSAGTTGALKRNRITHSVEGNSSEQENSLDGARLGWSKPIGPPLPIHCPKCNSVSASKYHVFGGRYWELWGNTEPCKCGYQKARLSEGVFNLSNEVAVIIASPQFTVEMFDELNKIRERHQAGAISDDAAVTEATAVSPEFGNVLKRALALGPRIMGAVFLIISAAADCSQLIGNGNHERIVEKHLSKLEELPAIRQRLGELERSINNNDLNGRRTRASADNALNKSAPTKIRTNNRENRRRLAAERRKALNPRHPSNSSR